MPLSTAPGLGCRGTEPLPFTGQGVGALLGDAHSLRVLEFSFPRFWWQLPGSGSVLRANRKKLGRMVRSRLPGSPDFKAAEIRAGAVGKMPQPGRAPLGVMNV